MPTKANTWYGMSSDFSQFTSQPGSLHRRTKSLYLAQRSLDIAQPSQSSRNSCRAVFWLWMSEANYLATMVKSQGAKLNPKG